MADNDRNKSGDDFEAKTLRETGSPYVAEAVGLSPAEQSLVADLVADGLAIQEKFRPEPLYKQTGKGHYAGNTVEEIQKSRVSKK
jgi:hypothetical protein